MESILLMLLSLVSLSSSLYSSSSSSLSLSLSATNVNKYSIYDNVISTIVSKRVDQEGTLIIIIIIFIIIFIINIIIIIIVIATHGGLGHTVYDRSISPRSSIESVCNSILTTLNDDSKYIEYWWRDEWIHLDAHKDVDEHLAKKTSPPVIRYPLNGHVLYLDIGRDVLGPTCLFFEKASSVSSPTPSSSVSFPSLPISEMAIVPAVTGRLLRFDGDIMHAVPRPALGYLDPEDGGSNLEIWSRPKRIDGVIDDESTIYRRSVLLFNTWNELPLDVDTAIPLGTKNYNEAITNDIHDISCNKYWNKIEPTTTTTTSTTKSIHLKLMLLGNTKERRGRLSRRIDLRGPLCIKDSLLDVNPSYYCVDEEES